jgi:hypothetical protein
MYTNEHHSKVSRKKITGAIDKYNHRKAMLLTGLSP